MAARICATMAVRGSHIIGAATATASGQGHLQERKQGHLIGCKDRARKKQRKEQKGRVRNEKKVRNEME
jgi:hypothetical protein